MKKTIALLLALVMVLSLAACGGNSAPAATQAPAATEAPAAEEPTVSGPVAYEAPGYGVAYAGEGFTLDYGELTGEGALPGNYVDLIYDKDGVYMELTANRLGPDAYEAAGVPFPADVEEYSMRAGVQSVLPEELQGVPFTYDDYGNYHISFTDEDGGTIYRTLRVANNAEGEIYACGVLNLVLPAGVEVTDEMMQWISLFELEE